MKIPIISVLLMVITLLQSSSAKTEIPTCLQQMINGFNATPRFSPVTRIDSYLYRGQLTYLATSSCCDRFNPLYDGECNQLCAPSGGFIGSGDGKCKDFGETAKQLGSIWVTPRG